MGEVLDKYLGIVPVSAFLLDLPSQPYLQTGIHIDWMQTGIHRQSCLIPQRYTQVKIMMNSNELGDAQTYGQTTDTMQSTLLSKVGTSK